MLAFAMIWPRSGIALIRHRPKKQNVVPGKPKHNHAAADPLVNPGNPSHCHQTLLDPCSAHIIAWSLGAQLMKPPLNALTSN